MLTVSNLVVEDNETKIMYDVSLSLSEGDFVILYGENEAGKTTLIEAIAGISKYKTRGKINFKGIEISNLSVNERVELGIVSILQEFPMIDKIKFLTLFKWLRFSEKKLKKYLKVLDLSPRVLNMEINKFTSMYETKAMNVLLALALDPIILLIDELEYGLTKKQFKKLSNFILDSFKTVKAILWATSSLELLKILPSAKVYWISQGKIILEDKPHIIDYLVREYTKSRLRDRS